MRIVIFDLGDTLEHDDVLLPGAIEMLTSVRNMRDDRGDAPVMCLLSDYFTPTAQDPLDAIQTRYYTLLETLGIRAFFEPVSERVTLSSELGVSKPSKRLFERTVEKAAPGFDLHHALFITEHAGHVAAARGFGMMAIHFKGPGQTTGEVDNLADLVPLISRNLAFSPCCRKQGEAVGRFTSQANKSKQLSPAMVQLVNQVSQDRLRERVSHLASFPTRWTYSPAVAQVPEWIHGEFLAMGYTQSQVRFQPFQVQGGSPQRNVLCSLGDLSQGFTLVCAHYDSLSENPDGLAPGADDNASGIAALLELAAILHGTHPTRGVLFAAFGGEEQGLFGSSACADIAAAEAWPIDVVVNMDMISFPDPANPARIIVEYDQGNRNPQNDPAAKAYGLLMAQAAADYTSLEVEHTDIWNSDYMPFEAKGFACIGAYEAGKNPGYHTTADKPGSIDVSYLTEAARMVLATVATVAGAA
ncbi:M20/M25/M40 family metallo-hydrolase [Roseimicrobium sp. ORNL1]|uniref:M20/M25/M40 family metallo-hydrolase n=1 Tax=Roseimicrobium sp. ORNL1 TaxID=2711231 RepID=UPI0013E11305|nr:M20/M25/M40 family metallo-hydrolase [Roseimicrobium sp. ORNL1]QIF01668.1 M20/M25/M40 family metallo-hydrolase [Roseimicrobium sp. ORNL1]